MNYQLFCDHRKEGRTHWREIEDGHQLRGNRSADWNANTQEKKKPAKLHL